MKRAPSQGMLWLHIIRSVHSQLGVHGKVCIVYIGQAWPDLLWRVVVLAVAEHVLGCHGARGAQQRRKPDLHAEEPVPGRDLLRSV